MPKNFVFSSHQQALALHQRLVPFVQANGSFTTAYTQECHKMEIGSAYIAEVIKQTYMLTRMIVRVTSRRDGSRVLESSIDSVGKFEIDTVISSELPALQRAIDAEQKRVAAHTAVGRFFRMPRP